MNIIIIIGGLLAGIILSSCWDAFCKAKGYSNLIKNAPYVIIAIILICSWCISSTPSFTGNPYKDAQIMSERIYEDGESYYQVRDELFEYYIDNGYGMERAKEALNICSEM